MRAALVIGMILSGAATAFGGTIYDNGSPALGDDGNAWLSNWDGKGGFLEVADDFTLQNGASTIRDIHWWGIYTENDFETPDNFQITIYNDALAAHTPGSVNTVANIISVQRTLTTDVITALDYPVYRYDAVVSDIVLAPGVSYWLSISNATGPNAQAWWAWAVVDQFMGNAWQYTTADDAFIPRSVEAAFYLTDDVPAPGALAMAGVVGVIATRRRRA